MSVQVAVRVRPFNQREAEMNSKLVVEMVGNQTILNDPDDPKKKKNFTFDFSFWSHDNFHTDDSGFFVADSPKYDDQQKVYDLVGTQILVNAWEGYHCCLFAYGQTGAGKSYSMVGYGPNKGIVPLIFNEIFIKIKENQNPDLEYQVFVSMMEIYNEKVQDLLIPVTKRPSGGLKIRESSTIGFFVDNLQKFPVLSYEEIEQKMDYGTQNRTVASTAMNNSSSRAHTIINIEVKQIEQTENQKVEKFSQINLVDLAGSERQAKTNAKADRLKEAGSINKSLTMLGMVISALADQATGKNTKVPYRDSCLTKILSNALGGNSKTLMICAVSPAQDNYEETLSTLRYADQAKKIKNKAVVNESATDKLIRELNQENEKLKLMISKFNTMGIDINDPKSMSKFLEMKDVEDQITANEHYIGEEQKSYKDKLQSRKEFQKEEINKKLPYLSNLNEDPMLSGKVFYSLSEKIIHIGRKNGNPPPQLVFAGMGINPNHAIFTHDGENDEESGLYLSPFEQKNGDYIFLNGNKVFEKTKCMHLDRVIFGTNSNFLLHIPGGECRDSSIKESEIDWEYAQEELTKKADQQNHQLEKEEINKVQEETLKKQQEVYLEVEKQKKEAEELIKKQQEELEKGQKESEETAEKYRQLQQEIEKMKKQQDKKMENIRQDEIKKTDKIKAKHQLEDQLTRCLPKVLEINLISKELKRNVVMAVKIVLAEDAKDEEQKKILIFVNNKDEGCTYTWDLQKFENRYYMIRELLEQYFDTTQIPQYDQENDPFYDPSEAQLIGTGFLKLLSLAYVLDTESVLTLVGENGNMGSIEVHLIPTDSEGKLNLSDELENNDQTFENPEELLGKNCYLKVKIGKVSFQDTVSRDVFVEYSLELQDGQDSKFKTPTQKGMDINFQYEAIHEIKNLSQASLDYIIKGNIAFNVYGFESGEKLKYKQVESSEQIEVQDENLKVQMQEAEQQFTQSQPADSKPKIQKGKKGDKKKDDCSIF